MSYARFSEESDVYVYASVAGGVECCGCSMGDCFVAESTDEMVEHLQQHIEKGDMVPDDIESALQDDDAENFGGRA